MRANDADTAMGSLEPASCEPVECENGQPRRRTELSVARDATVPSLVIDSLASIVRENCTSSRP